MSNLILGAQKDLNIYQLESTDVLQGGPGAIDNVQAQALGNNIAAIWRNLPAGVAGIVKFTSAALPNITPADAGAHFHYVSNTNAVINIGDPAAFTDGSILSFSVIAAGAGWLRMESAGIGGINDWDGVARNLYHIHAGETISFIKRTLDGLDQWFTMGGGYYARAGQLVLLPSQSVSPGVMKFGLTIAEGNLYDIAASTNAYPRLYEVLGTTQGSSAGKWQLPNLQAYGLPSGAAVFKWYVRF